MLKVFLNSFKVIGRDPLAQQEEQLPAINLLTLMGGFITTGYPLLNYFFSKGFFIKEKFDANGQVYYGWIPSIKLW